MDDQHIDSSYKLNPKDTIAVQKLKRTWYLSSPDKLFDQCINLIVKNVRLILVEKPSQQQNKLESNDCVTSKLIEDIRSSKKPKLKYTLGPNVGPLPNFICESLLKNYQKHYVEQLSLTERSEYFKLNSYTKSIENNANLILRNDESSRWQPIQYETRDQLITYYDLLMALVHNKNKASLSRIIYRSCIWEHSTLENRLQLNSGINERKSLRSKQPAHLTDLDLRFILKRKYPIEYLDICPCNLTNKSIKLINKYLKRNVKYLRFQNCCNWYSAEPKAESGSEENDNNFQEAIGHQPSNQIRNWFTENVINGINLINNDNNDGTSDDDPNENNHNEYILNNIGNYIRNKVARNENEFDQFNEDDDDDDDDNNISTTTPGDEQQRTSLKQDDEESDDDDEDFDMYLQDYINMYTNDQIESNQNQINFVCDFDEDAVFLNKEPTEEDRMIDNSNHSEKIVNSRYKRKHKDESATCDSNKYHKSKQREKENLLEFYENQLQLIRSYSIITSNRCKIFSLNTDVRQKQERKINKIQKSIKLLRRINLQNNITMHNWKSTKRDNETKSLIKFISDLQETIQPAATSATTSANSNNISIIEQIRQKAQSLRDTKVIDKVSITSSNCEDEQDLADFNDMQEEVEAEEEDEQKSTNVSNNRKKLTFKNSIYISSSLSNTSSDSSLSSSPSIYSKTNKSTKNKAHYYRKSRRNNKESQGSSIYFDQEEDELSNYDTLSTCSSKISSSSASSFASLIVSLSSLNTTTTSASSSSTFFSSNSTSPYNQQASHSAPPINLKSKRFIRQQRLLEKAASLSSSPINLLQAIAAKALNFKLKKKEQQQANSTDNQQDKIKSNKKQNSKQTNRFSSKSTPKSLDQKKSENKASKETKLATKYNQLLRQYRFFKSTNINKSEQPMSSKSDSSNVQMSDSRKIFKKSKRLKNQVKDEEDAEKQPKAVDMQLQPFQNMPLHLFSSFKYWMSKRIELLNNAAFSGSSEENINNTQQMEASENLAELSNDKINDSLLSIWSSPTSNSESFNSMKDTLSLNSNDKYFDSSNILACNQIEIDSQSPKHRHKQRLTRKFGIETLNLNNLLHLSFRNLGVNVIDVRILNSMFANLNMLKYLDLSNCCSGKLFELPVKLEVFNRTSDDNKIRKNRNSMARKFLIQHLGKNEMIGNLYGLLHLRKSLTHLIMADMTINDIIANLPYIICLINIQHLDISNGKEASSLNRYTNPSLHLAKISHHLRNLTSLDISATNLSGPNLFNETEELAYIQEKLYEDFEPHIKVKTVNTIKSSIPGLMFLNRDKLEFLGCFCCDYSITSRQFIPAVKIASEENELNLYNCLDTYSERPLILLDVLNHLFELYRDEAIEDKLLGGYLIMNTMNKHLDHSQIQISGCASLFYVLKYWKEENINIQHLPYFYLRQLITTVINGMEEHIDDSAIRRNCVLIMCRLNLPDDVLFISDRLIKILLKIFDDFVKSETKNPNNEGPEHFVLRTSMHLLNILACSVHGQSKSRVGSLAIPIAMNLIKSKVKFEEADDILEVTWSFLWNITDETPENCQIFLDDCKGMDAFMACIKFKKSEIIRNMMGLLGNVAEVKELRNRLCKTDYIRTFRELLVHKNDGIEIPYNSAGVLVHIMSDGPSYWQMNEDQIHDRDLVIRDVEVSVDKWNMNSERNINYRSFEPIFRLIENYQNPICQRWSCWALANLTTVYPDIYCPLFEKENGHFVLNKLLATVDLDKIIKRYAQIVLDNIKNNSTLHSLPQ